MRKDLRVELILSIILLVGNFSFFSLSLAAQSQSSVHPLSNLHYRARLYSSDDGLRKETYHTAIFKDVEGFLWLGSGQGELSKFDGNTFKQFHTNEPRGIFNTFCNNILEDSLHNIWIGTNEGLSRYDIRADTFSNIQYSSDTSALKTFVLPFWATATGVYCIEGNHIISRYDIHSLERKELMIVPSDNNILMGNPAILDEKNNCVWMLPLKNEGLVQLNLSSGEIKHHTRSLYKINQSSMPVASSEAMCLDTKRACIWINCSDGLTQFTLWDHQFHHIDAVNELVDQKEYSRWVGIDLDREGRIWFATHPFGLVVYDPDLKAYGLPQINGATAIDVGETNYKVYCDRDGSIWLSYWTFKGIYQLTPYQPAVRKYEIDPPVHIAHLLKEKDKKIWIGTGERGLREFDVGKETFVTWDESNLAGIKGKAIVPMAIDTLDQTMWVNASPPDKVYKMDMVSHHCQNVEFKNQEGRTIQPINIINFLTVEFDQFILFFDAAYGFFELNKDSLAAHLVIPYQGVILKMIKDREQGIFLFTPARKTNSYYQRINGLWLKVSHVLDELKWLDIGLEEKDKSYWVSLDNQVVHFDSTFRKIRTYGDESGLLSAVFSIQLDGQGRVWFTNDQRIIGSIDITSGAVSQLSESDGYDKQHFALTAIPVKIGYDLFYSGNALAEGSSRLIRVSTEKFKSAPGATVYIKSLKINHAPFQEQGNVNALESLSLKYNENFISLETGILNFFSKGKSILRYKLTGGRVDENWQFAPYYYTIRYEGLDPGNYKLIMQASNAANEFNGPEKIILIQIDPPFWATWWFRGLSILFGLSAIYAYVQYRSQKLKARNMQLELKIQERTSELHRSLSDLKTTQDQLIQSEKMASLGELTSGIAHEIKNPLNFISNFSEINLDLIQEMEEEFSKPGYMIKPPEGIKFLKKNSEKINHHGKRIDEIVKGMLLHSRTGNIRKEYSDINALCEDSIKLAFQGFRSKEKNFNCAVQYRWQEGLPAILIIPQEISRVLLNLANNAFYAVHHKSIKFQHGAVEELMQAESMYEPVVIVRTLLLENKLSVLISDNGMGIPAGIIGKIFQPFFTTKATGEGTGLGLSMAYDIITKSHGGEMRVKSKEGIGTDIEIILPY